MLQYQPLHPDHRPIARGPHRGDVGLDLATVQSFMIRPGGSANIPCGLAIALPEGTFGWVTPRSSTWSKHGLWVMPGIIDEGWRGEILVLVHYPYNPDGEIKRIEKGARLAQLIVLPNLAQDLMISLTPQLPPSERGTNGFGSSGA